MVESNDFSQLGHGTMFYKIVWDSQSCDLWVIPVVAHPFEYGRAETTGSRAVLDGDDTVELLCHFLKDVPVEWLEESHVVMGNADFVVPVLLVSF